jgi:predicted short-subunit dehydrogenase-like oxidoreductase (DUF2520 family)
MKIVLIGAGRVATALAIAFSEQKHSILKVISRSAAKAAALAARLGCEYADEPDVPAEAEVVIIAVNDDALGDVSAAMTCRGTPVIAHTAGSVGLEAFDRSSAINHGVFYPLQTFTHGRSYDFSSIPLFIESNNEKSRSVLETLASSLSSEVFYLKSEKRKFLHLAAVFACNFVNHLYNSGKEITAMAGMDFSVLLPLIRETMDKASDMGPEKSQTGPAVRNDKNTIEKHLDLLSFSPDLQKIYGVMTASIIKRYSG